MIIEVSDSQPFTLKTIVSYVANILLVPTWHSNISNVGISNIYGCCYHHIMFQATIMMGLFDSNFHFIRFSCSSGILVCRNHYYRSQLDICSPRDVQELSTVIIILNCEYADAYTQELMQFSF